MKFKLEPKKLIQIHDLMIKSRVLEERLIRMYKQNDGLRKNKPIILI